MRTFPRITQNPAVMGGKPCIRGLRVTVGMIVGQIGAGRTVEELLSRIPTSNVTMVLKPCAMRLGVRRSEKLSWPMADEGSDRHESLADLGRSPGRGGI